MHLDIGLMLLGAAGVLSWGCWRIGREFPAPRPLDDAYEKGYSNGWDDRGLADGRSADHLAALLSTGTGAADDEIPAPVPAPSIMPLLDPDCRDGKHGSCVGAPCECQCHRSEDEYWADTLHAINRDLAAEEERPASHTDQFRAVFSRADGLERQYLLTWDSKRKYDRDRPQYLRDMGISEQRIRQLLGAE